MWTVFFFFPCFYVKKEKWLIFAHIFVDLNLMYLWDIEPEKSFHTQEEKGLNSTKWNCGGKRKIEKLQPLIGRGQKVQLHGCFLLNGSVNNLQTCDAFKESVNVLSYEDVNDSPRLPYHLTMTFLYISNSPHHCSDPSILKILLFSTVWYHLQR